MARRFATDQPQMQKSRISIYTVDTSKRILQGKTQDGGIIQVMVWDVPPTFRWPQVGELWSVFLQNGYWTLGSRIHENETFAVEAMTEGESRIDSTSIRDAEGNWLVTNKNLAINLKDPPYNAVGDGEANDTNAGQEAIDFLAAQGGGVIDIPAGIYMANWILKPRVWLRGVGPHATVIKSFNLTLPTLASVDFDTLFSKPFDPSDELAGSYEARVTDLSVDGNTYSGGLYTWGRAMDVENLEIRNAAWGLWTEFTELTDFSLPVAGRYRNLSIHDCSASGWVNRGPRDSVGQNISIWDCADWGIYIDRLDGAYNGQLTGSTVSIVNTKNGICAGGKGLVVHDCLLVVHNDGVGLSFSPTQIDCTFTGRIADAGTGILLRGTRHLIEVQAYNNPGDVIEVDGAGGCDIRVIGGNNGNVFNLVSESSPNKVRSNVDLNSGQTHRTGIDWNDYSQIDTYADGGTPPGRVQFPTRILQARGDAGQVWSPQLPQSNGTLIPSGVRTLAPSGGHVTNNADLGTVVKFSIDNATANPLLIDNPTPATPELGILTYVITNDSADTRFDSAMTGSGFRFTWGNAFRTAGPMDGVGAGKTRLISFYWDGNNWCEFARSGAGLDNSQSDIQNLQGRTGTLEALIGSYNPATYGGQTIAQLLGAHATRLDNHGDQLFNMNQPTPQVHVNRTTHFVVDSNADDGDPDTDPPTPQAIPFGAERFDKRWDAAAQVIQNDQHSNSTNTSRITCRQKGIYYIYANVEWENQGNTTDPDNGFVAGSIRRTTIRKNGGSGSLLARVETGPNNRDGNTTWPTQNLSCLVELDVDDYIEVIVYHDAKDHTGVPAPLKIISSNSSDPPADNRGGADDNYSPEFGMFWISPSTTVARAD
jgi:hypothetical protein